MFELNKLKETIRNNYRLEEELPLLELDFCEKYPKRDISEISDEPGYREAIEAVYQSRKKLTQRARRFPPLDKAFELFFDSIKGRCPSDDEQIQTLPICQKLADEAFYGTDHKMLFALLGPGQYSLLRILGSRANSGYQVMEVDEFCKERKGTSDADYFPLYKLLLIHPAIAQRYISKAIRTARHIGVDGPVGSYLMDLSTLYADSKEVIKKDEMERAEHHEIGHLKHCDELWPIEKKNIDAVVSCKRRGFEIRIRGFGELLAEVYAMTHVRNPSLSVLTMVVWIEQVRLADYITPERYPDAGAELKKFIETVGYLRPDELREASQVFLDDLLLSDVFLKELTPTTETTAQ